jgi:uncharacterized protein (DUF1800 family)
MRGKDQRRRVSYLLFAALWIAGTAGGRVLTASEPGGPAPMARDELASLAAAEFDSAKARHLLARAGFGGTPDEVASLHALGLKRAVASLVEYRSGAAWDLPLSVESAFASRQELKRLPREERRRVEQERRKQDDAQLRRLRAWWIERMLKSPRPLEEKLTLFWHGHFATEQQVVRDSFALWKQQQLLREHADDFSALLHGIVRDAAMLRYLDNQRNERGRSNENLARELMELFSMGEGNYTERDVREAARALTGYTFQRESADFRFAAGKHDAGEKEIFGVKGNFDGDRLVDLILDQPATPRFIATKLFVFFVHDDPSEEVTARLAAQVRRHKYRLGPVLTNLFSSKEFYSPRSIGTQIKNPVQLVVGAHRALGVREGNYTAIYEAARNMAQDLFQPPNVKGWQGGRDWINSRHLFARYNGLVNLIDGAKGAKQAAGTIDVVAALEGKQLDNAAQIVDYLAAACLVTPLDEAKRQALIAVIESGPGLPPPQQWKERRNEMNARLRAALVLLVCMPEFQVT